MSENINPSQDFTIAFPTASLTNHGTTDSVMAHESTSMLWLITIFNTWNILNTLNLPCSTVN